MEFYNNLETTNAKFMGTISYVNEAFLDERQDLVYYEYLASMAPTDKEKEIIYSIMEEERVNATLLRRVYEEVTGIDVSQDPKEKLVMPQSYLAGINEIISRESREMERYKSIREGFPAESSYIYTLSNIIANELDHITQLNYILTLNNNASNSPMNENAIKEYTSNFTLDDWARFISPLVSRALSEDGDINSEQFYRKLILSGVLVGLGNRPREAIELVERWEQDETSKLLNIGEMSSYFKY